MNSSYDFDTVIDRHNTNSVKWDFAEKALGGRDVLPMWVADMDFRSLPEVIHALKEVADHGIFGYSGMPDSYYEVFISWMQRRHRWSVKPDWIVHTPGVVPAINMAIRAFTEPGDEVIVQTPGYHPFFRAIDCNRRLLLDNPLRLEGGRFLMDLDHLESKITPRTKLILLCSPQNPGGRVWTERELAAIGRLCFDHNIVVLSDEIHSDIVYRAYRHTTFATIAPDFEDRCILCTGVSKTFNLPGLHFSNIVIPNRELRTRFRREVLACGMSASNPFSIAAAEAAYRHGEPWLEALIDYLQGNIDYLTAFIALHVPGVNVIRPEGTYLVWLDLSALPVPPADRKTFLCSKAKVGGEEGTLFRCKTEGFWRLNIGCPRATLEDGLTRMARAVEELHRTR